MKRSTLIGAMLCLVICTCFKANHAYAQSATIFYDYERCQSYGSDFMISIIVYDESNGQDAYIEFTYNDVVEEIKPVSNNDNLLAFTKELNIFHPDQIQIKYYSNQELRATEQFPIELIHPYIIEVEQPSCSQINNASIKITQLNGTVEWADGSINMYRENLAPGGYEYTLHLENGCSISDKIYIDAPEIMSVQYSVNNMNCGNTTSSKLRVKIYGGTKPYTVNWHYDGLDDTDDQNTLENMPEGAYKLRVVDGNGCMQDFDINVSNDLVQEIKGNPSTIYPKNIDGSIMYFDLNQSFDTQYGDLDNDGIDGSSYNVSFYYNEEDAELGQNPIPTLFSSDKEMDLVGKIDFTDDCYAMAPLALRSAAQFNMILNFSEACDDGSPEVLGGTYTFLDGTNTITEAIPDGGTWEIFRLNANGTTTNTTADMISCNAMNTICTVDPFDNEGNYTVIYSQGADTYVGSFVVQALNPSIVILVENVCGNTPGLIATANPRGGTLSGEGIIGSVDVLDATNYIISPPALNPGDTYTFEYTYSFILDSNRECPQTASDMVTVLPFPDVEITAAPAEACFGQSIMLSGNGTLPGETIELNWYDPDNILIGMGDDFDFNNITKSGTYTLEAVASNTCIATATQDIMSLDLPDFQCDLTSSISCFGDANGVITINVNDSDISGYQYAWDNDGNGTVDFTERIQSGLPAGEYNITVTAPNGCIDVCVLEITQPDELILGCSITGAINCFGVAEGEISASLSGGTPPYSYLWSDNSTSPTLTNINAGTYGLIVTDDLGCTANCSITLTQPDELMATPSCVVLDCVDAMDGTASVLLNGGTAPFTYQWSNGSSSESLGNLGPGNYPVTITDDNDCSVEVIAEVKNPDPIQIIIDPSFDLCLDLTQDINYTIQNGAGPFTQTWTVDDDGGTDALNSNIIINNDNSITFNSLCLNEGTVRLRLDITDNNLCTHSETIVINLASCFDLALTKVIAPNTVPRAVGDTVHYIINVYNQGLIDAVNLEITDYLEFPLIFHQNLNTSGATGNENAWVLQGGNIVTTISSLPAGAVTSLNLFLEIDNSFVDRTFDNFAEITFFESILKPLPVDEDDPEPGVVIRENDNDIDDDIDGREDNPFDDDQVDFARVSLCEFNAFGCNNIINLSLDPNCQALIGPGDFASGDLNPSLIEVMLEDLDGNTINNPIGFDQLGDTIIAIARDLCSSYECWSFIVVEDKLPIEIDCPDTLFYSCIEDDLDIESILPLGTDNCEQLSLQIISDIFIDCPDLTGITKTRLIDFYSFDRFGNTSDTCTQVIHYRNINYFDISVDEETYLNCSDQANWDANGNDFPDIGEVGLPQFGGNDFTDENLSILNFCQININFTDLRFEICTNSYRIERTWVFIDWCNATTRFETQSVIVQDIDAPILSCAQEQFIPSDNDDCTLDINVSPFGNGIGAIETFQDCANQEDIDVVVYYLRNSQLNNPNAWVIASLNNSTQEYRLQDLEFGTNWVRYELTDPCGNTASCTWEINVTDNQPPNVVCDEFTQIVLDETGWATMNAVSIDDGSFDDCTSTQFAVRRLTNLCSDPNTANPVIFSANNLSYFDNLFFCCEDLSNGFVEVELIAWDENQNYSTCIAQVQVVEKSNAFLQCPTFENDIACLDSPESHFIEPTILNSNCQTDYLVITNDTTFLDCNQSRYIRNYRLFNNNDVLLDECTQIINRISNTSLDQIVRFPNDQTISCLDMDYNPSSNPNLDIPIISSTPCNAIAVDYSDKVFENTDGYCKKILRTWVITEHCVDEINYLFGEQVIYVNNSTAPDLICEDQFHEIQSNDCTQNISIGISASDDCTPSTNMSYLYSIDLNSDNIADASGFENSFNYNFPVGIHTVTWSVSDACGNANTCSQKIELVDDKNPTPYCIGSLTVSLDPITSDIELWAKDLDLGSSDNCDDILYATFNSWQPVNIDLAHYYKANMDSSASIIATESEYLSGMAELWDPVELSSSIVFNCSHIGPNIVSAYFHDQNENFDYCNTTINIQDPNNNCTSTRNIQGTVMNMNSAPVKNVLLELFGLENTMVTSSATNDAGIFKFENVKDQYHKLIASEESNYLEGISTLDLVKIQNHVLGKETLTDQSKLLAADIDGNHQISTIDLIELRKLILGIYTELPNVNSWQFYDDEVQYAEPWDIPNFITAPQNRDLHIRGIKIGDVNESLFFSGQNTEERENRTVNINAKIKNENGSYSSILNIDDEEVVGLQLHLSFDTGLNFAIETLDASVSFDYMMNENAIKLSLVSDKPLIGDILKLKFEEGVSKAQIASLETASYGLHSEVYNADHEILNLNFRLKSDEINFEVYQNKPNPFTSSTAVDIVSNTETKGAVKIYDSVGNLIHKADRFIKKGKNSLSLSENEFNNQKGIFIISIEINGTTKNIKAIRL